MVLSALKDTEGIKGLRFRYNKPNNHNMKTQIVEEEDIKRLFYLTKADITNMGMSNVLNRLSDLIL